MRCQGAIAAVLQTRRTCSTASVVEHRDLCSWVLGGHPLDAYNGTPGPATNRGHCEFGRIVRTMDCCTRNVVLLEDPGMIGFNKRVRGNRKQRIGDLLRMPSLKI